MLLQGRYTESVGNVDLLMSEFHINPNPYHLYDKNSTRDHVSNVTWYALMYFSKSTGKEFSSSVVYIQCIYTFRTFISIFTYGDCSHTRKTALLTTSDDDDDDDDEIAYFTVRWKTRKLVLSTAPVCYRR